LQLEGGELQSEEEAGADKLSQTTTARILYRYQKSCKSPFYCGVTFSTFAKRIVNMAAKCQAGPLKKSGSKPTDGV